MIGVLICTGGIRGLYRGSLTGFTHLDTHAATFTPTLCRVSSSSPVRVPCLRAYSGRRRSPPAPLLPAHGGTHSRLGFLAVVSPLTPSPPRPRLAGRLGGARLPVHRLHPRTHADAVRLGLRLAHPTAQAGGPWPCQALALSGHGARL